MMIARRYVSPTKHAGCSGRVPLYLFLLVFLIAGLGHAVVARAEDKEDSPITSELRERAVGLLREILHDETGPARVRAAEYLLALDYPQGVADTFLALEKTAADLPHRRIDVWAVLARGAATDRERQVWLDKILGVVRDSGAPDRAQALRALARLQEPPRQADRDTVKEAAASGDPELAAAAGTISAEVRDSAWTTAWVIRR